MRSALIFGAGKIGRGFLGQLLHRGGYQLYFVDPFAAVIDLLNEHRGYMVHVAGNEAESERIPVAGAALLDSSAWHGWLTKSDLVVSCVGAANIRALCATIKPIIHHRKPALDWLICENADKPAQHMHGWLGRPGHVGLVETQILRSGMEATEEQRADDPLAVRVHDWWTLPCDADAFLSELPAIPGLQAKSNFGNELQRKLYTFNGLNGPISYLGAERGHRYLHQAATDPELQALLDGIQEESAHGLVNAYGFNPEEHRQFQALARKKYECPDLLDPIARNAKDSARKLGRRERLLGPAMLCHEHGRFPIAYAQAIAAALRYVGANDDPRSAEVAEMMRDKGPAFALARFGDLPIDHLLNRAVCELFSQKGSPT